VLKVEQINPFADVYHFSLKIQQTKNAKNAIGNAIVVKKLLLIVFLA
jgi:hypothetical protein